MTYICLFKYFCDKNFAFLHSHKKYQFKNKLNERNEF